MRPANRTTASGSSFASSTASASRFSAPIGVLSSWLTLATKSRRIASTRCTWVRSSARTTTSRDVSGATRACTCVALPRRVVEHDLGLAHLAVAAHLVHERHELIGQAVVAHQAHRDGRCGRLQRRCRSASTITAEDDSTESTASAPGGTAGATSGTSASRRSL